MPIKTYSETRTIDRGHMARAVQKLVTDCGATFKRSEGGDYPGPRCIMLNISAPGGLQLNLDFDGDSCQPNIFVLPWHMAFDSDAKLNPATFDGDVNPYHKRKATNVAYGWNDLLAQLERGLTRAADGTAYLPQPVVACEA